MQLKCTDGGKELLSMVIVFTEFHSTLFTSTLPQKTAHCHVICWLNYVEQYISYIHFIPLKVNVISYTLSWLDWLKESVLSKEDQYFVLRDSVFKEMDFANDPLPIEWF